MARIDQFNIGVYTRQDADNMPEVRRIIAYFMADHPDMSQFAALHKLLLIADTVISEKRTKAQEKRAEKEQTSVA